MEYHLKYLKILYWKKIPPNLVWKVFLIKKFKENNHCDIFETLCECMNRNIKIHNIVLKVGRMQGEGSLVFGVQTKLEPFLLVH
jgi:hypothetical protein